MPTMTTGTARSDRTGLPHWETIPDDLPAAISEIKAALRERIAASGRTVDEVVAEVEEFLREEIADIQATRDRGEEVWPVIHYADIAAGTVSRSIMFAWQLWWSPATWPAWGMQSLPVCVATVPRASTTPT